MTKQEGKLIIENKFRNKLSSNRVLTLSESNRKSEVGADEGSGGGGHAGDGRIIGSKFVGCTFRQRENINSSFD